MHLWQQLSLAVFHLIEEKFRLFLQDFISVHCCSSFTYHSFLIVHHPLIHPSSEPADSPSNSYGVLKPVPATIKGLLKSHYSFSGDQPLSFKALLRLWFFYTCLLHSPEHPQWQFVVPVHSWHSGLSGVQMVGGSSLSKDVQTSLPLTSSSSSSYSYIGKPKRVVCPLRQLWTLPLVANIQWRSI